MINSDVVQIFFVLVTLWWIYYLLDDKPINNIPHPSAPKTQILERDASALEIDVERRGTKDRRRILSVDQFKQDQRGERVILTSLATRKETQDAQELLQKRFLPCCLKPPHMASGSSNLGQRPCLCTAVPDVTSPSTSTAAVAGSTPSTSTPSPCYGVVRSSAVKCKQCRAKPKFGFLRSQRSLDLVGSPGEAGSPARMAANKEAEARGGQGQGGRGRRARSAERYEGMRVNDRAVAAGLPRQTSLQAPLLTSPTAAPVPPPISSPPPSYDAVVGKGGQPPSYDEYLSQQRLLEGRVTPPPPWTQSAQLSTCPCDRCAAPRVLRERALRVALPPEQRSTEQLCPCSKCQPRYSSYSNTTNVNTAVLISLDTTTAMHSVLADGIALCNIM